MPSSSARDRIHLSDMMLNWASPLSPCAGMRERTAASQADARAVWSFDVEHADQREQAPRGVEIDVDLAVQCALQQLGRFVVDRAPGHIDGLDFMLGPCPHRFEIALADREIIADRAAEAGQAHADGFQLR